MEKEIADWGKFESKFVRFVTGKPKILRFTNWQHGIWFEKPGMRCDVLKEDNEEVQKQLTVTSRRLLRSLAPIAQKAENEGRDTICVRILRIGEGFDTIYEVEEMVIDDDQEG
jgi:hypothetical protein